MSSEIVHFEIMGPDGAALADFYRKTFGWESEPFEGVEHYYAVDGDGIGGIGGAVGQGGAEMPAYAAIYLGVDSIDNHLARIETAGGSTVVPRQVMPGVVAFAMFKDPAGNLVGLAENETPPAE